MELTTKKKIIISLTAVLLVLTVFLVVSNQDYIKNSTLNLQTKALAGQSKSWQDDVFDFLALRNRDSLQEAINILEKSKNPEDLAMKELLTYKINGDNKKLADFDTSKLTGSYKDIADLVIIDEQAQLADIYEDYPAGQQKELADTGIKASKKAAGLAKKLNKPGCEARYYYLIAYGYKNTNFEVAKDYCLMSLGIYRKLAEKDPDAYLYYVAKSLNNLGNTQYKLNNNTDSLKSHTEALGIYRKLAEKAPDVFLPHVAMSLNNLGELQGKLNDNKGALKSHTEALEIRRKLAEKDPDTYLYFVSNSLNNLGLLQEKLNNNEEALKNLTEALEIIKKLAEKDPDAYLYYIALSLNNLGYLQEKLNNNEEALKNYTEALEIFRKLAQKYSDSYLPYVAVSLNNLGELQGKLNNNKEALKSHTEALEIRRKLAEKDPDAYLPDLAMSLNNLGGLQDKLNDNEGALKSYSEALESINKLIELIPENKNYGDVYKSTIESAVSGLIDFYSEKQNPQNNKLVYGLIESLRSIDSFANIKKPETIENIKIPKDIIVLSIQDTDKNVIFLVKDSDSINVYRTDSEFTQIANKFWVDVYVGCNKQKESLIKEQGTFLFNSLPEEVKKIFINSNKKTIYLSLSSNFANVPFEFMYDGNNYIGKKHLLPRVYGVSMLHELLASRKAVDFSKEKMIVSINPSETSKASDQAAGYVINALKNTTGSEKINYIKNKEATKETVVKNLNNPDLVMFYYIGHGIYPDGLDLEENDPNYQDNLYSNDIIPIRYTNNPIIFLNSCYSGTTSYSGGGRYLGMAPIFLTNGAQAVLSSFYSIYVDYSVEFDEKFFDKFFNKNFPIGEAIMQTRNELDKPWQWGLHILTGNKDAKIKN